MSVQLPLPYIRPFGSKCFAGGLLHFRGSGFKAGDLLEPVSPPASAAGLTGTGFSAGVSRTLEAGVAGPKCHSMFKTPEREESPSRHGGTLADYRPTFLDAKKVKWSAGNRPSSQKLTPFTASV